MNLQNPQAMFETRESSGNAIVDENAAAMELHIAVPNGR